MRESAILSLFLLVSASSLGAQDACQVLAGATIVADDGEYLGKLTSPYDSESIFNEYGI